MTTFSSRSTYMNVAKPSQVLRENADATHGLSVEEPFAWNKSFVASVLSSRERRDINVVDRDQIIIGMLSERSLHTNTAKRTST